MPTDGSHRKGYPDPHAFIRSAGIEYIHMLPVGLMAAFEVVEAKSHFHSLFSSGPAWNKHPS